MSNYEETNAFLGTGWGFPPQFTANGAEVNLASREEDIFQSLQLLLSTQMNERSLTLDYGCELNSYLFEEMNTQLENNLTSLIREAIYNYEPRIETEKVSVKIDNEQEGLLLIEVRFKVKATNSRYNLVYPFYLNEAVSTLQ